MLVFTSVIFLITLAIFNHFPTDATIQDHSLYRTDFTLRGMPHSSNHVDRSFEIKELEKGLIQPANSHQKKRRIFVLYGLGGIGKTHLAASFARRHQATFDSIFWLDGSSHNQLKKSFAACARMIPKGQISERWRTSNVNSTDDLNAVITDVLDWLAETANTNWLLIFDNVDQIQTHNQSTGGYDLQRYLPVNHGSILITTRLAQLAQLGDSKRLRKTDRYLSKAIFQRWHGSMIIDIHDGGSELLDLLDGLPLALAQAASYIRETGIDISLYVQLYKTNWNDLMKTGVEFGSPLTDYERSIATTWVISLQAIEARSKSAAHLLRIWGFIDNKDFWHGLLQSATDGDPQWPEWLRTLARSEAKFLDSVRLLLRYSMVEIQGNVPNSFSMHPVVHKWTSYLQDDSDKKEFVKMAVLLVGLSVPTQEGDWASQQRLLPHAQKCLEWIGHANVDRAMLRTVNGRQAVEKLGLLFHRHGQLKEAEMMYQKLLSRLETIFGPDHPVTLQTVFELSALCITQGRMQEAELGLMRILQGLEYAPTAHVGLILNTVNNLGILDFKQGRYLEAHKLYMLALRRQEAIFGRESRDALSTANNLGRLYIAQGRFKEAEEILQRALDGLTKNLGPDHTVTLTVVNNLADLYPMIGRQSEAEILHQRALQGQIKSLGPNHVVTLDTVLSLGSFYLEHGRLSEAEAMLTRALHGYTRALGSNHRSTFSAMNNMGVVYLFQGRMQEAEVLLQQTVLDAQRAFGDICLIVSQTLQALQAYKGILNL
ncbi:P-loop containing nucleoside triphosphate hydrolase protein [Mariannaea sp. PMI_226]|nr:P-loop containing nucleoside triphosphate hydrolase protein [Mariannaea sp. PMI_226]